jgi:hypothetical protein
VIHLIEPYMTRSRPSVLPFRTGVVLVVVSAAAVATLAPAFLSTASAADPSPVAPPPQTRPAAAVAEAPADVTAAMRRAFTELAAPSAEVREAARSTLMSLERRYLDDLRALVERSRPLRPAQASALRQIVAHVYLSGDPYDADERAGFLGVRAQQIALTSADNAGVGRPAAGNDTGVGGVGGGGAGVAAGEPDDSVPLPGVGMVVVSRLPGFVAHRVLLDGDVILGIVEKPKVSFVDRFAFTNAIKSMDAGDTFHLSILRRGRLRKVELQLGRRPAIVNNDLAGDVFERDRQARADAYWREAFAPLLPEAVE